MLDQALTHGYADLADVRLHYVTAGSGPLVVLLHGFPEFWYSWRHQIAPLVEAGFQVVAPDMRGYNLSSKPGRVRDYTIAALVNDVEQLIRFFGVEKAHVVGHDWGGVVAWSVAIARPAVVDRLVIMNAPHLRLFAEALSHNLRQWMRSTYMLFFQVPGIPEAAFRANEYAAIEQAFRGMAVNKQRFSDADIAAYKEAAAQPGALTGMLHYYRALARYGSEGLFAGTGMQVHVPTLVVWGEQDQALGKELNIGLERFVPDLRITYVPHCSHWVQQDCPEDVNQALVPFLVGQ